MKSLRAILTIGAMVSIVAAPSFAQPGADYVLGNDDVIDVSVLNHPDLNRELTILPDGTVTYLWAGRYQAAGLKPAQLASRIQTDLEKRYNNVDVAISVAHVQSLSARVTGAVMKPGAYDIKPHWRVMDLVSVAGGFSARPAQISGRIIEPNGAVESIDIPKAVADPDGVENRSLEAGDLLLLDQRDPASNRVYVMGQVNKPGAYDLGDTGASILSVIAQAGNTTPTAALTSAYVRRGRTDIPLNLRPTLIDGKADPQVQDFDLQPGDVLFIPEIQAKVAVVGEVNKPGYYVLPEGKVSTALDGVSLAGGQTPTADLRRVSIVRMQDGSPKVTTFDLGTASRNPDQMVIHADDVVYIPSAKNNVQLKDLLAPLALIGSHLLP